MFVSECDSDSDKNNLRELTAAWPEGWWIMMRELGRE